MALKFNCENCSYRIYSKFLKIGEEAKCNNCGGVTTIPENAETISDSDIPEKLDDYEKHDNEPSPIKSQDGDKKSKLKYPALKTISVIYRIIALVLGIVSIIGLFYGLSMIGDYGGVVGIQLIIVSIIFGTVGVLTSFAISEGIILFIGIEKNTSEQNKLLETLINKIK